MSHQDLYQQALSNMVDEDFDRALELLNAAHSAASAANAPESDRFNILDKRSQCYIKLEQFNEALQDANEAIKLDSKNVNSYIKKGTAHFELEQFKEAQEAFKRGLELDPSNSKIKTWIRKAEAELSENGCSGGGVATAKVAATPAAAEPVAATAVQSAVPMAATSASPATEAAAAAEAASRPIVSSVPPSAKDKVKFNFYQLNDQVVLSIVGLRNIPEEKRKVEMRDGGEQIEVSVELPDGDTWTKTFDLLYPIDAQKSIVKHSPMKIEMVLYKNDPSREWTALEKSEAQKKAALDPKRYYPSSKGAKDWDGLEKDVEKSLEEEKPEGDAALNKFFQQIYSGASEDARRAMIKSFTESGGTVLSTNWDEVGKKKIEPSPPEGMEAKKWGDKK